MKLLSVPFALLCLPCGVLHADPEKPTPRERFLGLNPNYQKGTAEFYRRQYMPSAARAMTSAIDRPNFREPDAEHVLGELIDGFLEKYVAGGGTITRLEVARLVQEMDREVKRILKNDEAYARYVKWRGTTDRKSNALFFLMTAGELNLPLPKRLVDAGWTMKAHKVTELQKFAGYFNEAPDHVLLFENPRLSKDDKRAWLLVLAFQTERVRDAASERGGPFRSGDKKQPAIDLFWQTYGMVFFVAEGDFPAAQAELSSHIRSRMVGQPRFEGRSVPID
jgi:hypothetical protein